MNKNLLLPIFTGILLILLSDIFIKDNIKTYRMGYVSKSYSFLLIDNITISDFFAVLFGFKRAKADYLWLDTLMYCGDPKFIKTGYPHTYKKLLRTVCTDTKFQWAYYYGSALLGWYFNYPRETYYILTMGLKELPDFYHLKLHFGMLMYLFGKEKLNPDVLIKQFEDEISRPDHHPLLNIMLGNFYKQIGRYKEAKLTYEKLLLMRDVEKRFIERARNEIEGINSIAGVKK
ncbi:MAG: hypothetical protein AB1765_09905 [Candidatus Hydrogenedentota bacterium]